MNLKANHNRKVLVPIWKEQRPRRVPILYLPPRRAALDLWLLTPPELPGSCRRLIALHQPQPTGAIRFLKSRHVRH
jgi:hypothetical protein